MTIEEIFLLGREDIQSPTARSGDRAASEGVSPSLSAPSRAYRSDTTLIHACIDGSESAWQELVRRYSRLVYSIPRGYGLAEADCEDVLQNVFMITFRRLGSLRDFTCLSAWLITTTHRECRHYAKRRPAHDELDESIPDDDGPAPDKVVQWERRQLVQEALRQLDPRSQDLLAALFFDSTSPSYEQIAARLGMPEGSIGPTRARSFKKLATLLNQMGFDPKTRE